MKTRLNLLLLLIMGVWAGCDTEGNLGPEEKNFFVKYYGAEGNQDGVDFVVNETDQSLILLGTSSVGEGSRLLVIKTDWDGNVVWKKNFGGTNDVAKDIEHANDGGYILLAETPGAGGDNADLKLIKISSDGTKIDSVTYGLPPQGGRYANEFPNSVTPMGTSYLVTGSTDIDTTRADVGIPNTSDILHVQFDENLDVNTEFKGYSSNSQTEYGVKAVRLDVNRNYIFGTSFKSSTANGTNDDFNFWIFPVNDLGDFSGVDALFGNDVAGNDEILSAVCPAFPNGYFMVGTYTNGATTSDMYVARLIEDGGVLKKSQEGMRIVLSRPDGQSRQIRPTAVCQSFIDGPGYLVLGNEDDRGVRNIWLTKLTDSGAERWSASFGALGGNDDTGGKVAELPDGRIIILGTVNLGDENIKKMALFKLNRNGKFAN